jgi:hypothetical protein
VTRFRVNKKNADKAPAITPTRIEMKSDRSRELIVISAKRSLVCALTKLKPAKLKAPNFGAASLRRLTEAVKD